jgi:hypothetical protein
VYFVIDKVSKNILGEFESHAQAEALLLDLVSTHVPAAQDLVIISSEGEETEASPEQLRDVAFRVPA